MSNSTSPPRLRTDNLLVAQGSDRSWQWPLVDGDGEPLSSMTGYSARAQARESRAATEVLHEWTTENGGIVLADSTLTLTILGSESSEWDWASAVYDIEVVNPVGSPDRITQGRITVDGEVTR